MPEQPYDPVGAMGGLFAPAYIHSNPEAEAAAQKWQAENFAMTPAMVEATRGPSTTITEPGVMGRGSGLGSTTTTVPGSVDPAALKIMAQGGKYKGTIPAVTGAGGGVGGAGGDVRDQIASTLSNRTIAPNGVSLMRAQPPAGGMPPGMQMAYSPLLGLMGEGDNTGFMQGSFGGRCLMSDINISGVPNLGIPALGGFNQGGYFADPGAGLNNAYASQASNNRFFGQQAATPSTVSQSQLYGPLGFGGQTALSAATGAAYGRAIPQSSKAAVAAQSGAPPPSVFDTGTSPVPYLDSPPMGSFSRSPNYLGGSTSPVPPAPNFNQTFGQFVQDSGGRSRNQTALDAVNQFSGVGTGMPAGLPPSAGRGVDPRDIITQTLINGGSQAPDFGGIQPGGPGSSGSFADRFAPMMGGNPGTPSQYTTSPYTSAGGRTFQPNIPAGYQTLFSADNPGGALPVGGFRGR